MTSSCGIYAQRFNSSGVRQGVEFKVNTSHHWVPGRRPRSDGRRRQLRRGVGGFRQGRRQRVRRHRRPSLQLRGHRVGHRVPRQCLHRERRNRSRRRDGLRRRLRGGLGPELRTCRRSALGIFGRLFASTGTPIGGEFRVTDFTGYRGTPAVAMDGDGDFVVVWNTPLDFGGGGLGGNVGVMGRRFSSTGVGIGAEFLVNSYTTYSAGISRRSPWPMQWRLLRGVDAATVRMADERRCVRPALQRRRHQGRDRVPGQHLHSPALSTPVPVGHPAPQAISLNGDNFVVV